MVRAKLTRSLLTGLHRSLAQAKLPKLEKERRRRAFWSLYTIDRLLAANLGRPLSLQEVDIDAERPFEGSDEELEAYCLGNLATPATSPSVMTGSHCSAFIVSLVR